MPEIENIQEESREDRESESPKEVNENISQEQTIEQPQTINQTSDIAKSEIQNMEVHHHPKVEKKNFKEYLLEFIMIFLAVTLGFFAENIREHLSDNAKEKEYIKSLVQDLEVDQQVLAQNISAIQSGISMMDSMITILDNPSMIVNNTGTSYYLARLAPRLQPLPINDKTFQQLKNSGNFRLIKSIIASNKIMDYYNQVPLVRLLESINETEFTQYKIVAAKIFNPEIFVGTEGNGNQIVRVSGNPPLRTTDNELLQELAVFAVYMHGTKKGILDTDEKMKRTGSELIDFLLKEYHLNNE